jgi:chaperone modulatory protein CbpM
VTQFYTEKQTLAAVARLTRVRLVSYVEAEIVAPVHSPEGPVFRPMDLARLELLCDLADEYRLETEALAVVISLVDQLHGVRAELRTVLRALEDLPDDTRARISEHLRQARSTG